MEERDELKPCPFCGGKAMLKGSEFCWWIECSGCEFGTPAFLKKEEVIEAWNRRTNDDND